MKKIAKILAVLLVVALIATIFVGAGAAAFKSPTSKLDVSGTVVPGDTIKASVSFTVNVKNLAVGDTLNVESGFDVPWEAIVTVKGDDLTYTDKITNKHYSLDCINFMNIGSDALVTVTCEGTVPSSAKGSTKFVPLTVTLKASDSSESGTISTDSVQVYNTNNLEKDKSDVAQAITTLTQRIAKYNIADITNTGISFTIPLKYLSDAENCLSQAQNTSVSEYTASNYLLEAKNKISIAEKSVNELVLQVAKTKLDQVNSLIKDLKAINQNVDNISTKYTVYESTLSGYTTSTDTAKVDELIANIDELYKEASNKLYPTEVAPEIPSWLPWVIIGAIAAIVVAIVVILIVRRHKKNSWDELG